MFRFSGKCHVYNFGLSTNVSRAHFDVLVSTIGCGGRGSVIFHQFYLNCLAHASYLIGDEETSTAAVVDPQRDIDRYLAFAAEHKLQIKHVFMTHLHADFVAGHLELTDSARATRSI